MLELLNKNNNQLNISGNNSTITPLTNLGATNQIPQLAHNLPVPGSSNQDADTLNLKTNISVISANILSSILSTNYQQLGNSQISLPYSNTATANHPDVLTEALKIADDNIYKFLQGEDYLTGMKLAFDKPLTDSRITEIKDELLGSYKGGQFTDLPSIKLEPASAMPNANAAFSPDNYKIYVNQDFVNTASQEQLVSVLEEEKGHAIDTLLSPAASKGEGGELFADIVDGKQLSQASINSIKQESDKAVLFLDGKNRLVRESSQVSIISQTPDSGMGQLNTTANFRFNPYVNNSTLIDQEAQGTTFTLLNSVTTNDPVYQNWEQVKLNDGRVGYFYKQFVDQITSITPDSGTGQLNTTANFRSNPFVSNSTFIDQESQGTTFTLLDTVTTNDPVYQNWEKVQLNDGRTGYFYKQFINQIGPKIISTTPDNGTGQLNTTANFRSSPFVSNSTFIDQESQGTTFTLLDTVTTNDPVYKTWEQVKLNDGRVGYFYKQFVDSVGPKIISTTPDNGTGQLNTTANFRSNPFVNNSTLIDQEAQGTTFKLLASITTNDPVYQNWEKVQLNNGNVGYFYKPFVSPVSSPTNPANITIGFDRAAAFSIDEANQLKQNYGASWLNVYIGGPFFSKSNTSWTPTIVKQIGDLGFKFLSTYVGQQQGGNLTSNQGQTDGTDAVNLMNKYGWKANTGSIVCLDVEQATFDSNPAGTISYINSWVSKVESQGYKTAVYGNPSTLNTLSSQSTLPDYIWLAHYGSNYKIQMPAHLPSLDPNNDTFPNPTLKSGPWQNRRAWQFAGDVSIKGFSDIDIDYANMPMNSKPA